MRKVGWLFAWLIIEFAVGLSALRGQVDLRYLDSCKKACLRFQSTDSSGVIGLPNPYYSPSPGPKAMFSELYYWDCFFTNRYGLLSFGSAEDLSMAKNQVDNLIFLVNKYGFVPNANRFSMLNRSQPPFLSLMVKDIFDRTGDIGWLETAVATLEKEYQFWMRERSITLEIKGKRVVLNRYGQHANPKYLLHFYSVIQQRLSINTSSDVWTEFSKDTTSQLLQAEHWLAEAESGWDFTPRFGGRCLEFLPVDLNAILLNYENNMLEFYELILPWANSQHDLKQYQARIAYYSRNSKARLQGMNSLMWDDSSGLYLDYNFVQKKKSNFVTAASFYPVWLSSPKHRKALNGFDKYGKLNEKSCRSLLSLLSCDCVMPMQSAATMQYPTQWSYGTVWAPFQAIAVETIRESFSKKNQFWSRYIARSFCNLVDEEFKRSGKVLEKYKMSGSVLTADEYEVQPMMGWTSSVYNWMKLINY